MNAWEFGPYLQDDTFPLALLRMHLAALKGSTARVRGYIATLPGADGPHDTGCACQDCRVLMGLQRAVLELVLELEVAEAQASRKARERRDEEMEA